MSGGFRHFDLTLTGVAQRLSAAFPDTAVGGPDDAGLRQITLQPGTANANGVFVGGEGVSATSWAVRLAAASAGVPPAPLVLGAYDSGPIKLSDLWVIGTAEEILHVGAFGY